MQIVIIVPEVPEKLKWYQPQDRWGRIVNGPLPWRLYVDDMTGCVEIKRAPLFHIYWAIVGMVAAGIFGGAGYCAFLNFGDAFSAIFMICAPLAMIVFMPAVGAFGVWEDSTHWNGPLRFRYEPQNGELFFAKEKITYRPEDYSKLVLGCVEGIDIAKSEITETVQFFMLVLDKNEKWRRFNLSDDDVTWSRGHKRFTQVIERLQPLLEFEVFAKKYSKDECFAQQNSNATAQ